MVIASRDGWQPVENALESVRYCFDKYTLALASGSAPEVISDVVRSFGIEQCFLSMISGETIENCKPAPDIFLMSAKAIGIAPEECAVVEDSHNGVLAAKAAGMMCIGYINPHSGKQDLSMADYVIDDMGRIKDIL